MRMKIALIRLQSFYESFHITLNGRVRNGWISGNDKKKKKKSKNIVSSDDCYAEATFCSSK